LRLRRNLVLLVALGRGWEVVENLRRVLLSGLMSILVTSQVTQMLMSLLVSYLSLRAYIIYKPFKEGSDNLTAQAAQAVMVFNTLFIMWLGLGADQTSRRIGQALPLVIVVLNIGLGLVVGGMVARDFIFHSVGATAPARQRMRRRLMTYGEDTRKWANRRRATMMVATASPRVVAPSASSARARPIAVTPGGASRFGPSEAGRGDLAFDFGGPSGGDPGGQQVNPLFAPAARTRRQRNGTLLANVRQSVTHGLQRGSVAGKSRASLRVSQASSSLTGTNNDTTPVGTRKVFTMLGESNPQERPDVASPAGEGRPSGAMPRSRRSPASLPLVARRSTASVLDAITSVLRAEPAGPKRFNTSPETEELDLDALATREQKEREVESISFEAGSAHAGMRQPGDRAWSADALNPLFAHDATGEAEIAVTMEVSSAGGSDRHQVSNPLLSTELGPGDGLAAIGNGDCSESEEAAS
jgi:hypothetical protein